MSAFARRRAVRWGAAATAVTAVLTYGAAAALRLDLLSTTVSFLMFAALFGGTAAFVAAEVSSYARCPRCGWQQERRPGSCPRCHYDVRNRPRFVCDDGHSAYEPGVCGCGLRRKFWQPPDLRGPIVRTLLIGAAVFAALVVTGLLVE